MRNDKPGKRRRRDRLALVKWGRVPLTATATATVPTTTTIGDGLSVMWRSMMALCTLLPGGGQSPSSSTASSSSSSSTSTRAGCGAGCGAGTLRFMLRRSSSDEGRCTRSPGWMKSASSLGLKRSSVSTPADASSGGSPDDDDGQSEVAYAGGVSLRAEQLPARLRPPSSGLTQNGCHTHSSCARRQSPTACRQTARRTSAPWQRSWGRPRALLQRRLCAGTATYPPLLLVCRARARSPLRRDARSVPVPAR